MGKELAVRKTLVEVRQETLAEKVAKLFLLSYKGHTRKSYGIDLRQWFQFCGQYQVDPLQARRAHVDGWVSSMETLKPATLARKVTVIRNFYLYAVEEDFMVKSPVPAKDRSLHLPRVSKKSTTWAPDKDEARLLVAAASKRRLRDEVVVKILLHQGLRASELRKLDVKDMWEERGHHVWKLTRKGGKEETQAISPTVVEVIKRYVGSRTTGPLVVNDTGGRMTHRQVMWVVDCAVRAAGTRRFTPHSMRHACATMLLDEGVSLRDVQVYLGHSDPKTTERYDVGRKILDQSPAYALSGIFD